MISNNNINSGPLQRSAAVVVTFFKTMYNKTISRLGFYDILNNQVLGKCYRPRSNNCLVFEHNLYVGSYRYQPYKHPIFFRRAQLLNAVY